MNIRFLTTVFSVFFSICIFAEQIDTQKLESVKSTDVNITNLAPDSTFDNGCVLSGTWNEIGGLEQAIFSDNCINLTLYELSFLNGQKAYIQYNNPLVPVAAGLYTTWTTYVGPFGCLYRADLTVRVLNQGANLELTHQVPQTHLSNCQAQGVFFVRKFFEPQLSLVSDLENYCTAQCPTVQAPAICETDTPDVYKAKGYNDCVAKRNLCNKIKDNGLKAGQFNYSCRDQN